eukprot:357371-Chlamydomonas_euryale.AAC.3
MASMGGKSLSCCGQSSLSRLSAEASQRAWRAPAENAASAGGCQQAWRAPAEKAASAGGCQQAWWATSPEGRQAGRGLHV